MALYFIRHGQTYNNLEWRMNSWDDDDVLTHIGVQQAEQEARNIQETWLRFDIIISSHLIRAVKTAEIIANIIGFRWILLQDARLREQDGGIFKGRKQEDIKKDFWVVDNTQFRKIFKDKQYNKVEDIYDFEMRVQEVYNKIIFRYPDKHVLFVGHSWTYRCLIKIIHHLDAEYVYFQMPWIPNCQIVNLRRENK